MYIRYSLIVQFPIIKHLLISLIAIYVVQCVCSMIEIIVCCKEQLRESGKNEAKYWMTNTNKIYKSVFTKPVAESADRLYGIPNSK